MDKNCINFRNKNPIKDQKHGILVFWQTHEKWKEFILIFIRLSLFLLFIFHSQTYHLIWSTSQIKRHCTRKKCTCQSTSSHNVKSDKYRLFLVKKDVFILLFFVIVICPQKKTFQSIHVCERNTKPWYVTYCVCQKVNKKCS